MYTFVINEFPTQSEFYKLKTVAQKKYKTRKETQTVCPNGPKKHQRTGWLGWLNKLNENKMYTSQSNMINYYWNKMTL